MPSVRADPLTEDELQAVTEAASHGDYSDRLLGCIIPFTGLTPSEFCHLHRSWLVFHYEEDPDSPTGVTIQVPPESPCAGTLRVKPHTRHEFDRRPEPCTQCRPEGVWTPRTEARVRTIFVKQEVAVRALDWWFTRFESTPLRDDSVHQRVNSMVDSAGLTRDVSFTDLRWTFATHLISKGVDADMIAELLGMGPTGKYRLEPLYDRLEKPTEWGSQPASVSRQELIEETKRLMGEVGRRPYWQDIEDHSKFSKKPFTNEFGGIGDVIEAAGYPRPEGQIREEDMMRELRRLADELGRIPRMKDVQRFGKYSRSPYQQRFRSVEEACAAAGLDESHFFATDN